MPSATSHSGSGSKSSGPPPPSGPSGSEAGAGAAAPAPQHPASGTGAVQTEAMKQILGVIDKKLRNLEKKKVPGVGRGGLATLRFAGSCVPVADRRLVPGKRAPGRRLSPDPTSAAPGLCDSLVAGLALRAVRVDVPGWGSVAGTLGHRGLVPVTAGLDEVPGRGARGIN